MRFHSSIILLSLLTIPLCVDSQLITSESTTLLQSNTSGQLLAVTQTQTDGNPPPDRRSSPKPFNRTEEMVTPQLS
jgi:hypothetical protein